MIQSVICHDKYPFAPFAQALTQTQASWHPFFFLNLHFYSATCSVEDTKVYLGLDPHNQDIILYEVLEEGEY